MTTTDPTPQSTGNSAQPEPELTPAARLVYATIGALGARREDRANALLTELIADGPAAVTEALHLLCQIPTAPLHHLCAAGAGGRVEVPIPKKWNETTPESALWTRAALCAGELLGGTFGAHQTRLKNALAMLSDDLAVPVLVLLVTYAFAFLEHAAEVNGEAYGAYEDAIQERSAITGWSP